MSLYEGIYLYRYEGISLCKVADAMFFIPDNVFPVDRSHGFLAGPRTRNRRSNSRALICCSLSIKIAEYQNDIFCSGACGLEQNLFCYFVVVHQNLVFDLM